jgi:hypothetical protein
MAPFKGWLSPSYSLASKNVACQRSVNLFSEVVEVDGEKCVGYLRSCPGLAAALVQLGTGFTGVRGLLAGGSPLYPLDGSGGRMFAVVGSKLYEIAQDGTIIGLGGPADHTARGDVGDDGLPVQMLPNGDQLGIVSAGRFYIDNGLGPVSGDPITGTADTLSRIGRVTSAGQLVSWFSGQTFAGLISGDLITIDGVACHVKLPLSPTSLVTVESTTNAAAVDYSVYVASPATGTLTLFPTLQAGSAIQINNVIYTVTNVPAPAGYRVNLATDPGVSLAQFYVVAGLNGTATVAGTTLTWDSGDLFPMAGVGVAFGIVGATLLLDGTSMGSPTSVTSPTSLELGTVVAPGTYTFAMNPILEAASGAFLNSYFIVAPPSSKLMQASAAGDGTIFAPLDSARKETYPDNIGALYSDHSELYVLGESKSEVWRGPAADATSFPLQRDDGATMSVGIFAPASVAGFRDGLAFIGGSLAGGPLAYYVKGYQPERISTFALEAHWKTFAQSSDAIGFSYRLDGHELWQVTFPDADETWVYDRTSSLEMGKPMWHERTSWSNVPGPAAEHRHRANCHCYVWGKHWIGDYQNGKIYELSPTIYTDDSHEMACFRTLPHICEERLRQFFLKWQLDLETAKGGIALTVELEWSDDGGHTFEGGGPAFTITASTVNTMDRVVFWQLGSADDRVFRLTVTGNAPKALINAYLDVELGIS